MRRGARRLRGLRKASGAKKAKMGIALVCAVAVFLSGVAVATGAAGGTDPDSGEWHPVYNDEALPCTGPEEPVNFETFSPGPSVAGLPLTYIERRCDGGPPAMRANYVSYLYGDCEIPEGATGCQPPLEVQSWPACQRFLAKYSFEGKPLPSRKLPKRDDAEVVEFDFALDNRIEVYTRKTTIVIFSTDLDLARQVVDLLEPQEEDGPPATKASELGKGPPEWLGAPAAGAMKGGLSCHS